MAAPTMEERKACWGARDEFWHCLDSHAEDAAKCEKLRLSFESLCPQQWVKYFDRRRDFLKYKKNLKQKGFILQRLLESLRHSAGNKNVVKIQKEGAQKKQQKLLELKTW